MSNPDEAARYRSRILELTGLGHRGSGTDKERAAATLIQKELAALGVESELQPFTGSHAWGARYLVYVSIAAAGVVALPWFPWLTALLGLSALLGLLADHTTVGSNFAAFAARAPSQNVFARIFPTGERRRTVLLCAHYDTQRTGWIWNPAGQRLLLGAKWLPVFARLSFFPVTLGILGQIVLGLALTLGLLRPLALPVAALILLIDLVALILIANWTMSDFVPGAIDNGSGVAGVLALADRFVQNPIPGVELWLLLTGCEESGLLGAKAWAKEHLSEPREITFLNLDCIGGGRTYYLTREVPVVGLPIPYPKAQLSLAEDVASKLSFGPRPLELPGPTDGVAFLVRGFEGLTLCGLARDGTMPNYHLPSDVAEGVDYESAAEAIDFAWALMKGLSCDGSTGA